jgi:hypothetical protein
LFCGRKVALRNCFEIKAASTEIPLYDYETLLGSYDQVHFKMTQNLKDQ